MKKVVYIILSTLFSILIISYLFYRIDFELLYLINIFNNIPLNIVLICFLLYVFICLLRSYRFHIILDHKINIGKLFNIVAIHQLFNGLLPVKLGEFSYLYLIGKKGGIPAGQGAASLIIVRIFELVSTLTLISIALFLYGNTISQINNKYIFIPGLLISALLILGFFKIKIIFNIVKLILTFSIWNRLPFYHYINRKLVEVENSFYSVQNIRKIMIILITSGLIVFFTFYNSYLILYSIGLQLNFFQLVIAMSVTILGLFLPIQGIGNLGSFEATFLLGLLLFNIPESIAFPAVLALHIISFVFIIILGLFGWFFLNKTPEPK